MLAHDGTNGIRCFVSVVEWDRANIMMQDVCLNNAMQQVSANEAHLSVNGRCRAADIVPFFVGVVRQGRISMLKESNGNYSKQTC